MRVRRFNFDKEPTMRGFAVTIAMCLLAGCAHPPPPPAKALEQTCGDVARKLDRDSTLTEHQKRQVATELAGAALNWKLRVLTVSEQTSQLDMDRAIIMDAECADRPQQAANGTRYFMTVYFNQKSLDALKLVRGSMIQLQGEFSSYEGDAAFALQGRSFK